MNPTKNLLEYLRSHTTNALVRSLLVVATPNHASQLKSLALEFPNLQTIGIACDSVPLGCQRSGFSWLISENPVNIIERVPIKEENSRNWAQSSSAVRLTSSFNPVFDLAIPAANTLFTTGQIAEIYASGASSKESQEPLSALHVELLESFRPRQSIKPAKPLSDWLEVTSVVDNMLKTLDKEPAARFLEECSDLKSARDPAVFAELDSGEMFRVVAGGGGLWSPRASMLVLEPPASPRRGQMLRFLLELPGLSSDLESQLMNTPPEGIIAEVAPIPQTTAEEKPILDYKSNHHIPVFGFGSEHGFFVGGEKHAISGESLYFQESK